eukprot:2160365-Prorocentrum_lima.AAC.1
MHLQVLMAEKESTGSSVGEMTGLQKKEGIPTASTRFSMMRDNMASELSDLEAAAPNKKSG